MHKGNLAAAQNFGDALSTKYKEIYSDIRDRILRGDLQAGTPVPSERSLAKERGTGVITAAKALTELARDGYVTRQRGRGTFVADPEAWRTDDETTGALGAPQTLGIVVLGRSREDAGYMAMVSEMVQHATRHGFHTRCWDVQSDSLPGDIREEIMACDGLILVGSGGEDIALEIAWLGVPMVLAGLNYYHTDLISRVDRVEPRYDDAARMAVDGMVSAGLSRIALISGESRLEKAYADFREGYRAALAWHHIPFDEDLIVTCHDANSMEEGTNAAQRLLSLSSSLDGVICFSTPLAMGVERELHRTSGSVGGGIRVAATDMGAKPVGWPSEATLIQFEMDQLCGKAVELLLRRMQDRNAEWETVWLKPRIAAVSGASIGDKVAVR
jgi:GntR family transcriptional regulator, arabinose operon transcriptional repressor